MTQAIDGLKDKCSEDKLWQPFSAYDKDDLEDQYLFVLANQSDVEDSIDDLVLSHAMYRACLRKGIAVSPPSIPIDEIFGRGLRVQFLATGQLFALGSMFYEDENYVHALECFEACLEKAESAGSSVQEVFPVKIFAAYCCENLALENVDVSFALRGIAGLEAALEPVRVSAEEVYLAELLHALGHLHVALELVAADEGDIGYGRGSQYLAEASQLKSSYLSCYTASFSETGQYEKTAAETINLLAQKSRGEISLDKTSEMELIFYLGASYLFMGEYDLGKRSFELFRAMAKAEKLDESMDYGRFFLEKIDLKRTFLQELVDNDRLERTEETLSKLAFKSYQSEKLRRDCEVHISCLKNLASILGDKRGTMNGSILQHWLSELVAASEELGGKRKALALVVAENAEKRESARTELCHLGDIVSVFGGVEIDQIEPEQLVILYRPTSRFKKKFSGLKGHDLELYSLDDSESDLTRLHFLLFVLLANRTLSSVNDYIFRLSPCEDATTTEFQRPQMSLGRFTDGLKNHAFGL